ncbi:MAG: hypothetical protein QOH99_1027, partial [Frankiaceae bacterium]|nr:hypothetical protein [Frankiaceae bacterium]
MSVRRLLALSAVVGIVAAVTPLSVPASVGFAAATDATIIYTVDTNGDHADGLAKAFADGSGRVILAESAGSHYDEVEAAPVGEAIAYTKYVGNAIGLYVDNRELTAPRLLYAAHLVGNSFRVPYHPSFSPDGRTVLFMVSEFDASDDVAATHLETVPASGGPSTVLAGSVNLFDASFDPTDPTRISASRWDGDGAAVLGRLSGSTLTVTAVPGTSGTDFARISPDGQHVVFTHPGIDLTIAKLDGTVDGTVTDMTATYPVWQDATTVLFTMVPAGLQTADIFRFSLGAAAPTQVTVTPDDESALATPRAVNPAPTAPTAVTVLLNGSQPALSWVPPIDGDVTSFVVRRAVGTTPPATSADGVPVANVGRSGVTDTVPPGEVYSYSVFAVDSALQVSPAASITMQALTPTTISAPAAAWTSSVSPRIPVTWGAGAPAGTRFRLSYGVGLKPTVWHTWIPSTTTRSAVFGTRTTPGAVYTLRVVVLDPYGHATPAASTRVLVPRDQTAATFDRRWSQVHGTPYWLGGVTTTTIAGASVSLTFTGSRLQVLGDKCPQCGSFRVYVDGHYRGTYSSQGATGNRRVLYTY